MPKTSSTPPDPHHVAIGRLGAEKRYRPEQDHSALELEVAQLSTTRAIRRLVEDAPPLTKEQRAELVRLLRGAK